RYNQFIRPVENVSDPVTVEFEVSISQLVKVVSNTAKYTHIWNDYKLSSNKIWRPGHCPVQQVRLAVGDFLVEDKTKNCSMKFGSWTYDKAKIDLVLIGSKVSCCSLVLWESGEWESLMLPATSMISSTTAVKRSTQTSPTPSTSGALPLFYTINLIIPCLLISFLTVLVFYLPSDCGEKVTLCISVLLSLTVFLLVITETIPSTSLVIPLIGEYLLFTMIFVTLSIVITVFVLNVHYRTPMTHTMPGWVRSVFLKVLPRIMLMRRPIDEDSMAGGLGQQWGGGKGGKKRKNSLMQVSGSLNCLEFGDSKLSVTEGCTGKKCSCPCQHGKETPETPDTGKMSRQLSLQSINTVVAFSVVSPEIKQAIESVKYIAENMRSRNKAKEVEDDWKYVAMVIDRIFLWVFVTVCVLGTVGLFLQPLFGFFS
uniref:Cholinergic receptor, nicotinic, alpha 6 n=1 Tax=Sphaeramia orbicularis TaxID=375764 RepID=A0A673BEE1_9TELE